MQFFLIIIVSAAMAFAASVIEDRVKRQHTTGYRLSYVFAALTGALLGAYLSLGDSSTLMSNQWLNPRILTIVGALGATSLTMLFRLWPRKRRRR